MRKRTLGWRARHVVHNCIVHPLLPLAELCIGTYLDAVGYVIQKLHDVTSPTDDLYNVCRFDDAKG